MDEHGVGAMDIIVGATIEEAEVRINAVEFDKHVAELRMLINESNPTDSAAYSPLRATLNDTIDALVAAAKR